jgi:hypothetical protein
MLRSLLNVVHRLAARGEVLKGTDRAAARDFWSAVEDPGPPTPPNPVVEKATTVWTRDAHPQRFVVAVMAVAVAVTVAMAVVGPVPQRATSRAESNP